MHAIVYHAFNVCLRHKHTLTVIVRLQPICLGFFHSEYYPIMYAQIEKKVYELHYQIVSSFVLFVVNSLFLSLSHSLVALFAFQKTQSIYVTYVTG